MLLSYLIILATTALAAVNQPCVGHNGRPGVCLPSSQCTSKGGVTAAGCPGDGANVKCCTKSVCNTPEFKGGNCRWVSNCGKGGRGTNGCPGPAGFVCCKDKKGDYGGYKAPKIPPVGSCKKQTVDGAKKIVKEFPGKIREIGCYRNEPCREGREHGCGRAIDLMCSDAAGATNSGRPIAEWVMKNHKALKVKYVIWGQRIYNPSRDKQQSWTKWRAMSNAGGVTVNHWDHVHVSFN